MASAPIDRPEFSFQSVNLITEVITDSSPDDSHWVPLAPGREAAVIDQSILAVIR
jgi:hypothetical protein